MSDLPPQTSAAMSRQRPQRAVPRPGVQPWQLCPVAALPHAVPAAPSRRQLPAVLPHSARVRPELPDLVPGQFSFYLVRLFMLYSRQIANRIIINKLTKGSLLTVY